MKQKMNFEMKARRSEAKPVERKEGRKKDRMMEKNNSNNKTIDEQQTVVLEMTASPLKVDLKK